MGCQCNVCMSEDSKDKRLRCSSVLETDNGNVLLIDCSPDFREQMLRHPLERIDGVLITHEHYDHVGGIDDLRPYCRKEPLNLYAEAYVCERLQQRIPYCFGEKRYPGVPDIALNPIALAPFSIKTEEVIPIRVMHGRLPIFGYRIGRMAYLTDLSELPEEEYRKLEGIDLLVIAALRRQEHIAHQSLQQALWKSRRIAPRVATYLIHFSHTIGKQKEVASELPPNVYLSYDGLSVSF